MVSLNFEPAAEHKKTLMKKKSVMESRLQAEFFAYIDRAEFKYKGDVWGVGNIEIAYYQSADDKSGSNPIIKNSEMSCLIGQPKTPKQRDSVANRWTKNLTNKPETKAMNNCDYSNHENCHGETYGQIRGPSSFWMHDPAVVFNELDLKEGDIFLDLGCGPGDYSLQAAKIIGQSGSVYALDKWQYLVDRLTEEAKKKQLKNINTMVCDILGPLPIGDNYIDVCLLSTVLHIFNLSEIEQKLFNEIRRVLKPAGRVAIIECKKEDTNFGPPKHMRLSPNDIENSIQKYGFKKLSYFCAISLLKPDLRDPGRRF